MKLSIVIVNWNTRGLLRDCLSSIYGSPLKERFEVIVVDNASTDGSQDLIKSDFPQVKLIANDQNLGFSRANNQAVRASKGEYVLLLNSDTVVSDEALGEMIRFMDEHPKAGAATCTLLLTDGVPQPFIYGEDPTLSYLVKRILRMLLKGRFMHDWRGAEVIETDWVTGACMMVRKKTIDEIGLLDENMFMYFEDNDWCYRMRKRGWKIYYCPFVQITHLCGRSADRPSRKEDYYKSLIYFYRKHYSLLARLVLRMLLVPYRWVLARRVSERVDVP
ncbi:MAG: glycosyltransferase family 2 protein [Actinomycetota bacterium]|nr:glycosyltransferase family 2 protein [Actinomycetota bacterium]